MLAGRVLLAVCGLALAGFGVGALAGTRSCTQQSERVLALALGGRAVVGPDLPERLIARCDGARPLAIAAVVLARRGHPEVAVALADEAIRREPRSHEGWVALARALRGRGLPGAAGRAEREARRLNPRLGGPAAPPG